MKKRISLPMLPLIALIFPLGTQDQVIFSKKVNQHMSALEQRVINLPCSQSRADIMKNVLEIKSKQPDIIILCPSMNDETLSQYSVLINGLRPSIRSSEATKLLIYHYDNQFYSDPERILKDEIDDYFPTVGDLVQGIINYSNNSL